MQAGGGRDRAGQIEPPALALRLKEYARRGERNQQADGDVNEQHPAPGREVDEQAAQDQADRAARHAHPGVDPHGPVTRPPFREGDGDQRKCGRGGEGSADPLHHACGEQPELAGGKASDQRGDREQQDAGDEDPAAAQQVAGPAAEQQQPAERERVGVDDPLQVAAGEAERVLDVRQGHVHDGRVEHHHELRGRNDGQGQAQVPWLLARGGRGFARGFPGRNVFLDCLDGQARSRFAERRACHWSLAPGIA